MNLIMPDDINMAIADMEKKHKDPLRSLIKKLRREEPAVYDFLFLNDDMSESELNQDEQELLITANLIGWHIIRENGRRGQKISDNFLEAQLERNFNLFEKTLTSKKKVDKHFYDLCYKFNDQPHLINFLMGLMFNSPDNYTGNIRNEALLTMAFHLKTTVDCLVLDEDKWGAYDKYEKQYSEKDFKVIQKAIKKYIKKFMKGPDYNGLSADCKDHAEFIITSFGDFMYLQYLSATQEWNANDTLDCCLNIMPGKIMSNDDDIFRSVAPVLASFFNFLSDEGIVKDGRMIAGKLLGIEKKLIRNSNNPANWSIGKTLLNEAVKAGVDIMERKAMDEFIKSYNDSLNLKNAENKFKEKTGRNDPCPCGSGKKYKKCCSGLKLVE